MCTLGIDYCEIREPLGYDLNISDEITTFREIKVIVRYYNV